MAWQDNESREDVETQIRKTQSRWRTLSSAERSATLTALLADGRAPLPNEASLIAFAGMRDPDPSLRTLAISVAGKEWMARQSSEPFRAILLREIHRTTQDPREEVATAAYREVGRLMNRDFFPFAAEHGDHLDDIVQGFLDQGKITPNLQPSAGSVEWFCRSASVSKPPTQLRAIAYIKNLLRASTELSRADAYRLYATLGHLALEPGEVGDSAARTVKEMGQLARRFAGREPSPMYLIMTRWMQVVLERGNSGQARALHLILHEDPVELSRTFGELFNRVIEAGVPLVQEADRGILYDRLETALWHSPRSVSAAQAMFDLLCHSDLSLDEVRFGVMEKLRKVAVLPSNQSTFDRGDLSVRLRAHWIAATMGVSQVGGTDVFLQAIESKKLTFEDRKLAVEILGEIGSGAPVVVSTLKKLQSEAGRELLPAVEVALLLNGAEDKHSREIAIAHAERVVSDESSKQLSSAWISAIQNLSGPIWPEEIPNALRLLQRLRDSHWRGDGPEAYQGLRADQALAAAKLLSLQTNSQTAERTIRDLIAQRPRVALFLVNGSPTPELSALCLSELSNAFYEKPDFDRETLQAIRNAALQYGKPGDFNREQIIRSVSSLLGELPNPAACRTKWIRFRFR